jgi:hypothetical protein
MTTPIFNQVPRDRVYRDSKVLCAIVAEIDRRKVRRALILSSAVVGVHDSHSGWRHLILSTIEE